LVAIPTALADDDPVKIVVKTMCLGPVPSGVAEVEAAINEISIPAINVEIEFQVTSVSEYGQQIGLMMSSGEQLDLVLAYPAAPANLSSMYSMGQVMDLTDLLDEYGQGILAELAGVNESFIDGTSFDGSPYGVTCLYNKVSTQYLLFRGDILDKYEIDINEIETYSDLEAVYDIILENEPTMIPIVGMMQGTGVITFRYHETLDSIFTDSTKYFDAFGSAGDTGYGIVLYDDPYTVVDPRKTEAYLENLNQVYDWYQKGYVYKDAAISVDMPETLASSGNVFSFYMGSETGVEAVKSAQIGYPIRALALDQGTIKPSMLNAFVWCISSTSKLPEAAMKFMNLMYTSDEINNLMAWGIEGRDYVVVDGIATYPEGVTSQTVAYHTADFLVPNQYRVVPWEGIGSSAELREQVLEENLNAIASPLLGFIYDQSNVTNEAAAVANVIAEHSPALVSGVVSAEEGLQAYLDDLEDAGIDIILADMQAQLDAFWASKEE